MNDKFLMVEYHERHLIGYLSDCQNTSLLNNPDSLRRLVRTAAVKSSATVFGTHIKRYPSIGANATADIGESVFIVQVSPERRYASVILHSIYTGVKLEKGMEYIIKRLDSRSPEIRLLEGPELPPIIEEFI